MLGSGKVLFFMMFKGELHWIIVMFFNLTCSKDKTKLTPKRCIDFTLHYGAFFFKITTPFRILQYISGSVKGGFQPKVTQGEAASLTHTTVNIEGSRSRSKP